MDRLVVAFESERARRAVRATLERGGLRVYAAYQSGAEVLRALRKLGGGVAVCGYRLPDMTADQLADDLGDTAFTLALARQEQIDLCNNERLYFVCAPFEQAEIVDAARALLHKDTARQTDVPHRSGTDKAIVEAAKNTIMRERGMDEESAHRWLQKRSMDAGVKMADMAKRIARGDDLA